MIYNRPRRQKAEATVALSTLAVGSTIKINENGAAADYLVVHQGRPSTVYDDSCIGTWVMRVDCPVLRMINSANESAYAGGVVDTYLEGEFYNSFDSAAQSAIKQVKIPYVDGNGKTGTLKTGSSGLLRRVFVASGKELRLESQTNDRMYDVGATFSYFNSHLSDAARIANWNGAPTQYWCRDPAKGYTTNMWMVGNNGRLAEAGASNWKAVRPVMVLNNAALVGTDSGILKGV
jgi:hypothetical protein